MEKGLVELFDRVKKAADAAIANGGEEDRCLDALERLKEFPVNYAVLVSTRVGKSLRQLIKHPMKRIQASASDVMRLWKDIIVKDSAKTNREIVKAGKSSPAGGVKIEGIITEEEKLDSSSDLKGSILVQELGKNNKNGDTAYKGSPPGKVKMVSLITKKKKLDSSSHLKGSILVQEAGANNKIGDTFVKHGRNSAAEQENIGSIVIEQEKLKAEPMLAGRPRLSSLQYTNDKNRDKIREIVAEGLGKVATEVEDDAQLRAKVDAIDLFRVAAAVETEMYSNWGSVMGAHKMKYRSLGFNIKDPKNPDFRRKVLLGECAPDKIVDLSSEEMASDARQMENMKIREKALFDCERASPNDPGESMFTCPKCKKNKCTYYQMQTRRADEPMTTFLTCLNCNYRWRQG